MLRCRVRLGELAAMRLSLCACAFEKLKKNKNFYHSTSRVNRSCFAMPFN